RPGGRRAGPVDVAGTVRAGRRGSGQPRAAHAHLAARRAARSGGGVGWPVRVRGLRRPGRGRPVPGRTAGPGVPGRTRPGGRTVGRPLGTGRRPSGETGGAVSEQAGAAAADRGDAPAQPLRGDPAGRRLWRQRASEPSGAVRRAAWSGLALTVGQLALMATNLVLSLGLGYAGGLAVVGATAPAVLVFQLTCGVLQRTFAEATLLASAHTGRTGDRQAARWSVAGALLGGTAGGLVAVLASVAVPHAPVRYAVVYAAGIPFAIALDIGRSADVAQGKARAAFADAAVWLTVHIGLTTTFAAVHSPMGICLSWTLVNVVFCAVAALRGYRSPALRGLTGWLRSRRGLMGSASLDALLVGL